MKKSLFIIVAVAAMFTSCKQEECDYKCKNEVVLKYFNTAVESASGDSVKESDIKCLQDKYGDIALPYDSVQCAKIGTDKLTTEYVPKEYVRRAFVMCHYNVSDTIADEMIKYYDLTDINEYTMNYATSYDLYLTLLELEKQGLLEYVIELLKYQYGLENGTATAKADAPKNNAVKKSNNNKKQVAAKAPAQAKASTPAPAPTPAPTPRTTAAELNKTSSVNDVYDVALNESRTKINNSNNTETRVKPLSSREIKVVTQRRAKIDRVINNSPRYRSNKRVIVRNYYNDVYNTNRRIVNDYVRDVAKGYGAAAAAYDATAAEAYDAAATYDAAAAVATYDAAASAASSYDYGSYGGYGYY